MQQSRRLAILRELLSKLTGQATVVNFTAEKENKASSISSPGEKRLAILQELLRRLAT